MAGAALDLYWFGLDVNRERRARWRDWLSAEERAREARFLLPAHGERFLAARAHLRWLLARQLGCAPGAVRFELGANGKPELAGTAFHFNLSHSGDYALVGIHPDRELGVDIEAVRARRNELRLARRFFTPAEAAWLESLPPPERARGFCRLWTCKEAWMKSDGRGMTLPLSRVEVAFPPGGAELRELGQPHRIWYVRELDLVPGYAAAVVMEHAPERITAGELRLEA